MADISKISPDGGTTEYNIKDSTARSDVSTINGKIPSGASSSNKMATASDVASRVDWSSYAMTGVHNILPVHISTLKTLNVDGTWSGNAYTINGITYTISTTDDGYVTKIDANNTASANADLRLGTYSYKKDTILNGCPQGSDSGNKFFIMFSGTSYQAIGSDVPITTDGSALLYIRVTNGTSVNHIEFYPMIRLASDTNTAFTPYVMTNKELTNSKVDWSSYAVTGAVNAFNTRKIIAGADRVTINSESSINVKNTTAGTYVSSVFEIAVEPNKNYYFKCDIDYVSGSAGVSIRDKITAGYTELAAQINITADRSLELSFNSGNNNTIAILLFTTTGTSTTGESNYNNILVALSANAPYALPAMTNRELTEFFTVKQSAATSVVTGATVSLNKLTKFGKVVMFNFRATGVTCNAWTALCSIPEEYRPKENYWTILASGSNRPQCVAFSGGSVQCAEGLSNVGVDIAATWITA